MICRKLTWPLVALVTCAAARQASGAAVTTLESASASASSASAPVQTLARPWADGVSSERQEAALALLREGNALLRESLFVEAVKKFRGALSQWDHPGIHYNLALALLNLDQPLEVHEHLELALRYGAAPLDADKFEHARSYLTLVEKQLAPLEVRCELYGATVALDGRKLFVSPGEYKSLVRPGPHTITAVKEGYPTTERTRVLLPGEPTTLNLRLYTAGELIEYRRPWPLWKPVAVTAAGAALVASGVLLTFAARDRFDAYDHQIQTRPECAGGCSPDAALTAIKHRGETYRTLSTFGYVGGGLLLASGVILLAFDRSIPYRTEPEKQEALLLPTLGAHGVGLTGTMRF